jgi:hypothetical protein
LKKTSEIRKNARNSKKRAKFEKTREIRKNARNLKNARGASCSLLDGVEGDQLFGQLPEGVEGQ